MRLEGLPGLIPIEAPPFVEPDKVIILKESWEKGFNALEQICGERHIIDYHTLIPGYEEEDPVMGFHALRLNRTATRRPEPVWHTSFPSPAR